MPYFIVEAAADEDGLSVAITRWKTADVDWEDDVPFMGGDFHGGVQLCRKPACEFGKFPYFVAITRGELALCKILNKVLNERVQLTEEVRLQWVDELMTSLELFAAATDS